MARNEIRLGYGVLREAAPDVRGGFVEEDGVLWYRIEGVDRMDPFLVSVVSDSDHWLFASSRGGLTAGRRNAESALFPYTTDDRVHDSSGRRGPVTVLLVEDGDELVRWEPFRSDFAGLYRTTTSLLANTTGNRLRFEERNHDLGLTFGYEWAPSERFGLVRRAWLRSDGGPRRLRLVDGLLDLLPAGVASRMQTAFSNLVDAYKRAEAGPGTLAVYRLASVPVDRPVPCEALAATTVWSTGLQGASITLDARGLEAIRRGERPRPDGTLRGQRCAYLLSTELELPAGGTREWSIVAEVEQDTAAALDLVAHLASGADLEAELRADVERGTRTLERLVRGADGGQRSGSPLEDARHLANTLFNVMRGGLFEEGYRLPTGDVAAFLGEVAPRVAERHAAWLASLPAELPRQELVRAAAERGDPDLERLVGEYLPLSFSRRHGDPSRPWNAFSIEVRQRGDGGSRLAYAGNWRDIFQNWEALCATYPRFLPAVVSRFVNASTADGYNPYRLTRAGFEWEAPDPEDPWAHIGYWGDHQVVYLQRLLELWRRHEPGALERELTRQVHVHADVPYRIADHAELLRDPWNTIAYDHEHAARIQQRVAREGHEGRLVHDRQGRLVRVSLAEKLLLPLLVKLSNLVPEVGIWMNTQRPEWNDANNALVGRGASVVTLCQLRPALLLVAELFEARAGEAVGLAPAVARFARRVDGVLATHEPLLAGSLDDARRMHVQTELGLAGEEHRRAVYAGSDGERVEVPLAELARGLRRAEAWVRHSILASRRDDGLFHAYNLIEFRPDGLGVRRLPLMLEGQVAALSCGLLDRAQSERLLDALRASALFRADQHSYLLYPDRDLPRFLERNTLPADAARRAPLLAELVAAGDRSLVAPGPGGSLHFAAGLGNASALDQALDRLAARGHGAAVARDRAAVRELYEELFDHAAFTGRSSTFAGYEGLGCIYWHQVSKLLLATHECMVRAREAGEPTADLARHYRDLRLGLGSAKDPATYGAFPTQPYSHTPSFAGARQPGMTGQVKEDFLCRLAELGVEVRDGRLGLAGPGAGPLHPLAEPAELAYTDVHGVPCTIPVPAGALAFTLYRVPVLLQFEGEPAIEVHLADDSRTRVPGHVLGADLSAQLFDHTGHVRALLVHGRRPSPA